MLMLTDPISPSLPSRSSLTPSTSLSKLIALAPTPAFCSLAVCVFLQWRHGKKMSLLKAALRVTQPFLSSSHGARTSMLQGYMYLRSFSTEAASGTDQPSHDSADPFLQTPTSEFVYVKLFGINRHTLKTDIINMFEGCTLTPENVKVVYNRLYNPVHMIVQFPSRYYPMAARSIARRGRLFRFDRASQSDWDTAKIYNGSYVLLQGIPRNAAVDDIHRFLVGFNFDPSSLDVFTRATMNDPIKMATLRCPSPAEATSLAIRKNRGFFLNDKITVRVLQ